MKIFSCSLLLFVLTYFTNLSFAQDIVYGSNNGKYLDILNTQIYYEEYGHGIPLFMLHGGTGSIVHYEHVIPEFAKEFRVIAIDSPGHGRSEQTDSLSYQLLANYFSEIIDKLELDSVYIIGWSDGGEAALLLAVNRPEKVRKILISGTLLGHEGYTEIGKKMVSAFSPEYMEEYEESWIKDYTLNAFEGNNWRNFISDLEVMWNEDTYIPRDLIPKIKCKTMIVLGDRDLITIEHGAEMYRTIKGSEFAVIPNSGHMVFWDKPELITNIGLEFFKKP